MSLVKIKRGAFGLFVLFLVVFSGSGFAGTQDLPPQGEPEFSAADYLGIYLQVPQGIQEMIGLKTANAKKAETKDKIPLYGRIPQDVEDITDVYTTRRGVLLECEVSVGVQVTQGQKLCEISVEEENEVVTVRAPSPGVVIAQFSKPGQAVDVISPLLTIADYSRIPVNFDVYEKDVSRIRPDQKVLVHSSAWPGKAFEGRVTFISPRIDETTLTLKIRARVDNSEILLKPGMFVRGEVIMEAEDGYVKVPSFSVQNLEGINVVFIQDDAESFIPTQVHIAYQDGPSTVIKGEIREGDRIVVEGAYSLKSKILEGEIAGGCMHGH